MKDHLVVVFGMMAFFNRCFRGKKVKHYIFGSLNYRINFSIQSYLLFVVSNYNHDIKQLLFALKYLAVG